MKHSFACHLPVVPFTITHEAAAAQVSPLSIGSPSAHAAKLPSSNE